MHMEKLLPTGPKAKHRSLFLIASLTIASKEAFVVKEKAGSEYDVEFAAISKCFK